MKKCIMLLTLWVTLAAPAFALDAPINLKVQRGVGTDVTLQWDAVQGSAGYYVYHGTKSAGESGFYDFPGTEHIENTSYDISNLLENTTYYFAVTQINEIGDESAFSNETSHTTGKKGDRDSFRVQGITVENERSIRIGFSDELAQGDDVEREVIVRNANTSSELSFASTPQLAEESNKEIIIEFQQDLEIQTKYNVTILSLQDKNGRSIQDGIDGLTSFTTPSTFVIIPEEILEEEVVIPEPKVVTIQEESIPLNSAPSFTTSNENGEGEELLENTLTTQNNTQKTGASIGGELLTQEEIEGTVAHVAQEQNTKLPRTGPMQWMIFILAVLLTAGFVFTQKRKV